MKTLLATISSIVAIMLSAGIARPADIVPMAPADFTDYVASQFKQALPGYDVTVAGPLTVKISRSGSDAGITANLDRMHDFCVRNANGCGPTLQTFVTQAAGTLKNADVQLDAAMLRAVVRPKAYIQSLRKQIGDGRVAEMGVEDLPGDLAIVCYVDFPTAARPAMAVDFSKLGISREAALLEAKENVARALGPLSASVTDLPERGIGTLSGNFYESSWLALHDAWADTAQRFGGELIVSAPAGDKVLYAKRIDRASVDALRSLANQVARQSDRPLSASVYHWTKDGWEQLAP